MTDDDLPWTTPLPPYGLPLGPAADSHSVLSAYANDEPLVGHSEHFHVEGTALVVDGDIPIALRLRPGVVLVRTDVPEGLERFVAPVAGAMSDAGLELLDEATLLAAPVALQILGLRFSTWDLWGDDIDQAFDALRTAAVGDQGLPGAAAGSWDW